jgi:hypothetical protein
MIMEPKHKNFKDEYKIIERVKAICRKEFQLQNDSDQIKGDSQGKCAEIRGPLERPL